jgi:hypothetical protein
LAGCSGRFPQLPHHRRVKLISCALIRYRSCAAAAAPVVSGAGSRRATRQPCEGEDRDRSRSVAVSTYFGVRRRAVRCLPHPQSSRPRHCREGPRHGATSIAPSVQNTFSSFAEKNRGLFTVICINSFTNNLFFADRRFDTRPPVIARPNVDRREQDLPYPLASRRHRRLQANPDQVHLDSSPSPLRLSDP